MTIASEAAVRRWAKEKGRAMYGLDLHSTVIAFCKANRCAVKPKLATEALASARKYAAGPSAIQELKIIARGRNPLNTRRARTETDAAHSWTMAVEDSIEADCLWPETLEEIPLVSPKIVLASALHACDYLTERSEMIEMLLGEFIDAHGTPGVLETIGTSAWTDLKGSDQMIAWAARARNAVSGARASLTDELGL